MSVDIAASAEVVMLHGFTGSAASWRPVVDGLPKRRTAALALPGHDATRPVEPTFLANIDTLASRVDELASEPCHLVGYSLGARACLAIAAKHPRLVSRLTLIGCHPGLGSSTERKQRRQADQRWVMVLRERGISAFVEQWEDVSLFSTQRELPVEVRDAQRQVRLAHDPHRLAESLEQMGLGSMPSYQEFLSEVTVPVHFVVGALDHKFVALAQTIAERNASISCSVIPACGHNVLLESPAAVTAAIADAH